MGGPAATPVTLTRTGLGSVGAAAIAVARHAIFIAYPKLQLTPGFVVKITDGAGGFEMIADRGIVTSPVSLSFYAAPSTTNGSIYIADTTFGVVYVAIPSMPLHLIHQGAGYMQLVSTVCSLGKST